MLFKNAPIVIQTRNLGKKYQVDRIGIPYRSLREDLMKLSPFNRGRTIVHEEFLALQNLNLEIRKGESVGIIGSNGSGKSTLLKLLSRVTWPSVGEIELLGRIGALLEVGVGFHHDLSGRENVYLCGAILGMQRKEVAKRFDEIASFSEIEDFLEMPVKKYSSGMFLRLAFSIMAHLNSEILIVDEIIAVGDESFQDKCLRKMKEILKDGRTIIFVSHHSKNIQELCTRTIWLNKGNLVADGPTELVLEKYSHSIS